MDIYLVNIAHPTSMIAFPIGLAYIARALDNRGLDFDVIDLIPLAPGQRKDAFIKRIGHVDKGVFGFGLRIGNRSMDINIEYARTVKAISPNNVVVFGGPLATSIPELLFEKTNCDYIVMGEGESRFTELAASLMGGETEPNINGVLSRHAFTRQKQMAPVRKIDHIDDYAPPLYARFDMGFYTAFLKDNHLSFELMSSRGCRGNCAFCFRFIGKGFHSRTTASLLEEIAYVHQEFGFSDFIFRDENTLQNKRVFVNLLKETHRILPHCRYKITARLDDLNEPIIDLLSDANVTSIGFGVESLNQATLDRINKGIRLAGSEHIISLLHRKGIEPRGSFIIGFPDDTVSDFEAMRDFIGSNGIIPTINFLTPLPKTALMRRLAHLPPFADPWAYVRRIDRFQLYQELAVNLTSMSDDMLRQYHMQLSRFGDRREAMNQKYEKYLRK